MRELDGLRGIAIFLVLMIHGYLNAAVFNAGSRPDLSLPMQFVRNVFRQGWIGVDLFFVLSGYLITGILLDTSGQPRYYRNFIVRRALRILPLYYGFLLVCVATRVPDPAKDLPWFFTYAGNIRVFFENRWPDIGALAPFWSLQIEEQYYLTFPWMVKRLSTGTLARLLCALVVIALALRTVFRFTMPGNIMGLMFLRRRGWTRSQSAGSSPLPCGGVRI